MTSDNGLQRATEFLISEPKDDPEASVVGLKRGHGAGFFPWMWKELAAQLQYKGNVFLEMSPNRLVERDAKKKGLVRSRGRKDNHGNAAKAPPVGLENVRKTRGKREVTAQGLAKWLALGVTTAEWQNLPDAAKVFLQALLQTMAVSQNV